MKTQRKESLQVKLEAETVSAEKISKILRDLWDDPKYKDVYQTLRSSNDYIKYFKDVYNWDIDSNLLDDAWDLASEDAEDEDESIIINGETFYDRSDANRWLNSKLNEYGNTHFFPSEDRITLNKLIDKFGNTYFWRNESLEVKTEWYDPNKCANCGKELKDKEGYVILGQRYCDECGPDEEDKLMQQEEDRFNYEQDTENYFGDNYNESLIVKEDTWRNQRFRMEKEGRINGIKTIIHGYLDPISENEFFEKFKKFSDIVNYVYDKYTECADDIAAKSTIIKTIKDILDKEGYPKDMFNNLDESLIVKEDKNEENKMIITVESGISADGFDIIIKNDNDELFRKSYRYGYDASYSREHAESAKRDHDLAIKNNWEYADLYYNLRPYTQDIIEDLMKKYHVSKNNIIVTNGKNVFAGEPVSDKNTNKFINNYIKPINESKEVPYDNTTKKKCPRCGQIYTQYPALSRRDNKTYICPDCGTEEAMEDYFNAMRRHKDESRDRVAETIGKFIYNLGDDAWSYGGESKTFKGYKIYKLYKNGEAEISNDEIIDKVLEEYPELELVTGWRTDGDLINFRTKEIIEESLIVKEDEEGKVYECMDCGKEFENPFEGMCPYCGSGDIASFDEDDLDECLKLEAYGLSLTDMRVEDGMLKVKINGKEYGYQHDVLTPEELKDKFDSIAKHSEGKAFAWLKAHSKLVLGGKEKKEEPKEELKAKDGQEFTVINADEKKIRELEKGSAFTWEGMDTSEENLKAIVEFFKEETPDIKLPVNFYIWEGKLFNEMYGLTGKNAYPDDLSFVSISLDNWSKMGSLPMVKLRVGARWLDDIVDNNAMRESLTNESFAIKRLNEEVTISGMKNIIDNAKNMFQINGAIHTLGFKDMDLSNKLRLQFRDMQDNGDSIDDIKSALSSELATVTESKKLKLEHNEGNMVEIYHFNNRLNEVRDMIDKAFDNGNQVLMEKYLSLISTMLNKYNNKD